MLFVIHSNKQNKQQRWGRLKEIAAEVVSSVLRRHPPVEKIEAPEWPPLHYQRSLRKLLTTVSFLKRWTSEPP
jgi:hypothetical protein